MKNVNLSKFILVFIIPFLSFTIRAKERAISLDHCKTSSSSCEFYSCAEDSYQCGQGGYFVDIARPFCEESLGPKEKSKKIKRFQLNVRKCLQDSAAKFAPKVKGCKDFKEKALDSHVGCFVKSGYCDLSLNQKRKLFKNPFMFLKIAGLEKSINLYMSITKGCRNEK